MMEKFTKPELLNFLCEGVGEDADNQFVNSPNGGLTEDNNQGGL